MPPLPGDLIVKVPNNFSARAYENYIELRWDRPNNDGYPYEIVRFQNSIDSPSEVLRFNIPVQSSEQKVSFIDNRFLERGQTYLYTVCLLDPGILHGKKKPVRVYYQPNAPAPILEIKLTEFESNHLGIDWNDYQGVAEEFEIYVETKYFKNIANKTPKKIASAKSCVYSIGRPEPDLYVAVVPSLLGRKILSVNPTSIRCQWKHIVLRDPSITIEFSPIAQYEEGYIDIAISYAVPESVYHFRIGDTVASETLVTDENGNGKSTITVPFGVGAGRHQIIADNGSGSSVSSVMLVPVRLSPILDDIVNFSDADITEGFNTNIIDKIQFERNNVVNFLFNKNFDFNLETCSLNANSLSGAIMFESGLSNLHVNIPVRNLPTFSYPPFAFDMDSGSLNLFGLVQKTKFIMMSDWVEHINNSHKNSGGVERVIRAAVKLNEEKYGEAMVDSGQSYEGDFQLAPGFSYMLEVREPINEYCISADGMTTLQYPSMNKLGAFVLVANGTFHDAESWADEINRQHEEISGFERVVASITPWNTAEQQYGHAMIDTGASYEGNFILVNGKGYIIETKEQVSNFILSGQPIPTENC